MNQRNICGGPVFLNSTHKRKDREPKTKGRREVKARKNNNNGEVKVGSNE